MTATRHKPAAKRVSISKLSDAELQSLDEKTFLASLSPKLRKVYLMAKPLRGKLTKAIEAK